MCNEDYKQYTMTCGLHLPLLKVSNMSVIQGLSAVVKAHDWHFIYKPIFTTDPGWLAVS